MNTWNQTIVGGVLIKDLEVHIFRQHLWSSELQSTIKEQFPGLKETYASLRYETDSFKRLRNRENDQKGSLKNKWHTTPCILDVNQNNNTEETLKELSGNKNREHYKLGGYTCTNRWVSSGLSLNLNECRFNTCLREHLSSIMITWRTNDYAPR